MVYTLAVRTDISEIRKAEYDAILNKMDLAELVKEFFTYVDCTDESESGNVFHPVTIGCCRCLMTPCLNEVLKRLRKEVNAL